MKLLFTIAHPAQFHFLKNIIRELSFRHEIKILIAKKDILEDLCLRSGIKYELPLLPSRLSSSYLSFANVLRKRYFAILKHIRHFQPDLILGSEITLALLGKRCRIPSIIFSEDDAHIIPKYAKIVYPNASVILSPESCNAGKWESKKTAYKGFQKLAYLHPARFRAEDTNISELIKERFFILRLSGLNAYHDRNRKGLNKEISHQLIEILKPHGRIIISSEFSLSPEFELYRYCADPSEIHNLMSFAEMYIGDSQSMAMEAALLGIPGIRFNDFAGEIGVLEELEKKYKLTTAFKTNETGSFLNKISEMLGIKNLKSSFQINRNAMLKEKIDVAEFIIWFIENYPESQEIMKNNPDFQLKFVKTQIQ